VTSPYCDPASARTYRLVTAPAQFAPPAADLVALLGPSAGMRVLDVGTGTGVVAERILDVAGSAATVVGIDAAIPMLAEATGIGYPLVVGVLPQLPFRTGVFDMAAAGFVISHVADYVEGLQEIARVCRRGALIGITTWGSLPNPAAQLWTSIASEFVARRDLDAAFRAHIPWDEEFADPHRVRQALDDAGLAHSAVETRVYRVRLPTADFLVSRDASMQGAVLRERLSDAQHAAFQDRLRATFAGEFGDVVEYDRDAHFGIAEKR